MNKPLPHDVRSGLARAREIHDRAASDYAKCLEFNALLAGLPDRLEDAFPPDRGGPSRGVPTA
ncbi:MAG: hypothetical protein AB1578_21165 [Thermodesulfobacteriota bacterium]